MTKEEQQKFFGISNDVVFKIVFCQQYFAKKLIEKTLNQKIGNITYIDSEKEFLETIGNIDNKGVRFDIYVEDDLGNRFDIEMQNYQKKDDNLTFRMRYYMHMMDVNHLNKGQNYINFPHLYTIAICNFKVYRKSRRVYLFDSFERYEKDLEQDLQMTNVYVSTKNKIGNIYVDPELNSFLEYIKDNTRIDCEFVKEIDEEVKKINLNPEKKKAMLTYQMERNYLRAEGKAEGIAEGEAKGRAENLENIVVTALKEKCSLEFLSKITQTSVKKIKAIAKKHKIEIDE